MFVSLQWIPALGQQVMDSVEEDGVFYASGYGVGSVVGVKGLDKVGKMAKIAVQGSKVASILEKVSCVDDLVKLGITSADDLARAGIGSVDDLAKLGITSEDDLARLGIKSGDAIDKLSPSEIAKKWQGSKRYPGIDDYENIQLHKGDKIYILESDYELANKSHSGYATTGKAVEESNYNSKVLSEGLQIKPFLDETAEVLSETSEYRPRVVEYTINADTLDAAWSEKTLANPQYGKGGMPQYFINNIEEEIGAGNIIRGNSKELSDFVISSDEYFRMISEAENIYYMNGGK